MAIDTNGMSDDELLEHVDSLPVEEEEQEQDESETEEDEVDTESEELEDEDEDEEQEDLEDTEEDEETEEVDDTTEDTLDTDETEDEEADEESQTEVDEEEETEDTDKKEDTPETGTLEFYKAFHDTVTAPYKANGKEQPGLKDPKDFVTALSMASNYALKTTAMKPHMGRIKMLKDVTDAELNEMLDFRERNPEVIKKALKEAGIDPIDLGDDEEESSYVAKDHSISSEEIEFDEVIEPIKGTPEFAQTTKVVTEVWDERSKRAMLSDPRLLVALNEEIQMGRYDQIQGIIDQNRLLGKTGGRTDLEMYQEIATTMNSEAPQEEPKTVVAPKTVVPKEKVQDPVKKAEKQKAGISTKKKTKAIKKYDPTTLSDEAFMELVESGAKFL